MSTQTQSFTLNAQDGQSVRGVLRDTGSGPVGFFLHGLLSNAEGDKSMTLWNEAERNNRSWVRFDMRAHGQSDGKFDEFTISRALEDTRAVFELFPKRPKILVGSSMGGWVAAQLATETALNVAAVVLIAPAFSFMDQLYQSLDANKQTLWVSQGFWTFDGDDLDEGFRLSYQAVLDSRQYDLLGKSIEYDCPVRILHGKLDDTVPSDQSLEFMSRLPMHTDVEVEILPHADHRLSGHIKHITDKVNEVWPSETRTE